MWVPGHTARLKTVGGEAGYSVVLRWDGKIELKVFEIGKGFYPCDSWGPKESDTTERLN